MITNTTFPLLSAFSITLYTYERMQPTAACTNYTLKFPSLFKCLFNVCYLKQQILVLAYFLIILRPWYFVM